MADGSASLIAISTKILDYLEAEYCARHAPPPEVGSNYYCRLLNSPKIRMV